MATITNPLSNDDINTCIDALGTWGNKRDMRVEMMQTLASAIKSVPDEVINPEVRDEVILSTEQSVIEEDARRRERKDKAIIIRAKLLQYRPTDGGVKMVAGEDQRSPMGLPSYDYLIYTIQLTRNCLTFTPEPDVRLALSHLNHAVHLLANYEEKCPDPARDLAGFTVGDIATLRNRLIAVKDECVLHGGVGAKGDELLESAILALAPDSEGVKG
jgi:hypothetical protein